MRMLSMLLGLMMLAIGPWRCEAFLAPSSSLGQSSTRSFSWSALGVSSVVATATAASNETFVGRPASMALLPTLQDTASQPQQQKQRIVFGTAALSKADDPLALLDAAFDLGFRRFDLARTYGGHGVSERLFGTWLKDRSIDRFEVEIITKGGMGDDKYGDPNRPLLTRAALQKEVQASLDALQCQQVDMYMFHRDDLRLDVSQFVLWANELVANGQTSQWGVSNWSFERFKEAYEFSLENGLEPPRANSPQFSLAVPAGDVWPTTQSISGPQHAGQLQWYAQNGVELLCWEVLAKGFMAKPAMWSADSIDKDFLELDSSQVPIGTDQWRLHRLQKAYCHAANYHRRNVAVQLAQRHGYKLSQIAVQYILSKGSNVSVIFGSNRLDHLHDMVGLADWQLDRDAIWQLDMMMNDAPTNTNTNMPTSTTKVDKWTMLP